MFFLRAAPPRTPANTEQDAEIKLDGRDLEREIQKGMHQGSGNSQEAAKQKPPKLQIARAHESPHSDINASQNHYPPKRRPNISPLDEHLQVILMRVWPEVCRPELRRGSLTEVIAVLIAWKNDLKSSRPEPEPPRLGYHMDVD